MGRKLPIHQRLVRVWRTGKCRFTDISVNEHPIVEGEVEHVSGDMEHYDSPDLDHWLEKQNRYTTAEAIIAYQNSALGFSCRILNSYVYRYIGSERAARA